MVDLPGQFFGVRIADAQILLREVTRDRNDLSFGCAPVRSQLSELFLRALANQHMNRFAALQQIRDKKPADEAGGAGDEVGHAILPWKRVPLFSWRQSAAAESATRVDCTAFLRRR